MVCTGPLPGRRRVFPTPDSGRECVSVFRQRQRRAEPRAYPAVLFTDPLCRDAALEPVLAGARVYALPVRRHMAGEETALSVDLGRGRVALFYAGVREAQQLYSAALSGSGLIARLLVAGIDRRLASIIIARDQTRRSRLRAGPGQCGGTPPHRADYPRPRL